MPLKFYETVEQLPDDVREAAETHLASVQIAIEAAKGLGGCSFRGPPSFHARAEEYHAYANDGNTRVPGTKYMALWVWDFSHDGHDCAGGDWSSWYHGSLCYAIASHIEMHIRDSDRKLLFGGTSADLVVGRWPEVKQDRVHYTTGGADLHLTDETLVTVAMRVREVIARLDVLRDVKLMRNGVEERLGRKGNQ